MATGRGRRFAQVAGLLAGIVIAAAACVAWPHLRFWWLFEPLGTNAEGCSEFRHRETGIVLVRLPGGTFLMGSPATERGRKEDELQHVVTLSPFLMAKYEVDQAQWKRVTGSAPRGNLGDELPIQNLTWDEARAFCDRSGLELPTEAQWEYACRGGSAGAYGGTGDLEEMGWYVGNCKGKTQPLGRKRPNAFGIYDLHGNAEEWCRDVYDEGFYSRPEACGRDPVCTSGLDYRVSRGGFRYDAAENCRSAVRRKRGLGLSNCLPGVRPAYSRLPW